MILNEGKQKAKSFLSAGLNVAKIYGKKGNRNYSDSKVILPLLTKKKKGRKFPIPEFPVIFGKGIIDLSGYDLEVQARLHGIGRVEVLGRNLTTIAALTSQNLLSDSDTLDITGAIWQASKGSKKDQTVAAHLNLMVQVGGLPLTELVKDPFQKAAIQVLYTHTHLVDERINLMDSWLEKAFLRRELQTILRTIASQLKGCSDPSAIESGLNSHFMLFARDAVKQLELMYEELELKKVKYRDQQSREKLEASAEILEQYRLAWTLKKPPESISRPMILNSIEVFKN